MLITIKEYKTMYYYILIDKQEKTIQLRPYVADNSCEAREIDLVSKEYGITYNVARNRFTIFHNDQKNYIDFNTFYKKYNKYTVKE
jgi:hypothetical protein